MDIIIHAQDDLGENGMLWANIWVTAYILFHLDVCRYDSIPPHISSSSRGR